MASAKDAPKDAYRLILDAIDGGLYRPVIGWWRANWQTVSECRAPPFARRCSVWKTQSLLARDGRSLIVASLDHNQIAELYAVRSVLEGLAAGLAARHATDEEISVLKAMLKEDEALQRDPVELSRANRRFHKMIHLASHNRFLVQQLDLVHRSMALMATTSLAAEGRGEMALQEHTRIVDAIARHDAAAADQALREHISAAYVTRLRQDVG